jgi:hypothetical protein
MGSSSRELVPAARFPEAHCSALAERCDRRTDLLRAPQRSDPAANALRLGNESLVGFYPAVMAPDLKHPATGDLIVLAEGEQLWRIGWPGAPVLVVTKSGPDGNAIYRLADPKCKTWNKVGDMKLVPWPEAAS